LSCGRLAVKVISQSETRYAQSIKPRRRRRENNAQYNGQFVALAQNTGLGVSSPVRVNQINRVSSSDVAVLATHWHVFIYMSFDFLVRSVSNLEEFPVKKIEISCVVSKGHPGEEKRREEKRREEKRREEKRGRQGSRIYFFV
jgi:hypothetical protein